MKRTELKMELNETRNADNVNKKAAFLAVGEASEAIFRPTPGVNARAVNDSAGFPDCLIRMGLVALQLSFINCYYCIRVMRPW